MSGGSGHGDPGLDSKGGDKNLAGGNYVVQEGDSLHSLGFEFGLLPETIWNHPENSQLKAERKHIDHLLPGDGLFVPELREKVEDRGTEKRHRFRRKGVPAKLRLRFTDFDGPRANENYTVAIDGALKSGVTDGDGALELFIPPNAQKAIVLLGKNQDRFEFSIGHVGPIETTRGVQARLNNLHYFCGPNTGELNALTQDAVRAFQTAHGLSVTGELDGQTRSKLKDEHGS